jgi:hypothetical protein
LMFFSYCHLFVNRRCRYALMHQLPTKGFKNECFSFSYEMCQFCEPQIKKKILTVVYTLAILSRSCSTHFLLKLRPAASACFLASNYNS